MFKLKQETVNNIEEHPGVKVKELMRKSVEEINELTRYAGRRSKPFCSPHYERTKYGLAKGVIDLSPIDRYLNWMRFAYFWKH